MRLIPRHHPLHNLRRVALALAAVALLALAAAPATAQTAFTYQAELEFQGSPGQGEFDFTFVLFDAAALGNQLGVIVLDDVEVRDGLFSVQLDFGSVFDGSPRFLEIQVKPAGQLGSLQTLSPRERLTAAPSALFSLSAVDADTVDGADAVDLDIQSISLMGTELRIVEGGFTFTEDLAALVGNDNDMDPANELNTALGVAGTDLELTDAGGTLTADLSPLQDGVDDADADPANETITSATLITNILQLIENGTITNLADVSALLNSGVLFDGTSLQVTDGGGTLSVDLSSIPDGVTDADADPANEFNTGFDLNGTSVEVTDAGGTLSADISGFPVEDADADPANELISDVYLTNANDALEIVEAGITNAIDVSPLQNSAVGFDGTSLTVTDGGGTLSTDLSALGDDADADPANELNTAFELSGSSVEVTDAGGTLSADISGLPVEDADANPANELIADAYLTHANDTLEIVEAGITNAIDVSPLQNSAVGFDGTSLTVADGGGTLSADLSALGDDGDADPANELNTSFDLTGTSVEVTDAGGTLSADISGLAVEDADANPANELIADAYLTNANDTLEIVEAGITNAIDVSPLQNASVGFDGTSLSVTDGGGTLSADISALGDDADADPANELNTGVTLNGSDLEITDAGGTLSADLSVFTDGTDDADADPANELITGTALEGGETLQIVEAGVTNEVSLAALQNASVTFTGTDLQVTDGGGTVSVDISALGDDADANSANELNTALGVSGSSVQVTDAGGTLSADLVSLQDGVNDADSDPANELISDLYLTNSQGTLALVDVSGTNEADVTPLQNSGLTFSGSSVSLTDGGGTLLADLSSLDDPNTAFQLVGTSLQLTDSSGTLSVDISSIDGALDADTQNGNELITNAVLNGTTLELDEGGAITSVDLASLIKADSAQLYDNFGWTDASDPVTNSINANSQKVLQITEEGTSNVFEIDFNRIQPGTIITNIPITITQPGFYYLIGDLSNSVNNADGIVIDIDDVTIDMMGYSLVGGKFTGVNSDDGIVVLGSQTNIKVRNGGVRGWNGDGINALNADFSIWTDLHVRSNDGDGLVTDFNNLIERVTAYSNGLDGIEGDDGTVIFNCTAGQNGDNGLQASEGCAMINSASFDNETDGFDIGAGGVIKNCSASDNGVFGFDIALGGQATECAAYDNMSNGFDMASACILRDCIGSLNNGHGVRTFANSYIIDNKFHENDLDGIRISSTDCHVEANQVTDNDMVGIHTTSSGSFIVKNTAAGNLTNYLIDANCAFGPIVNVINVGDITSVANADHPWANFQF
ncbi:MAG: right-handed parallel beta-helix repeat-containing protein [Acidobacteriota bacterium]